MKKKILSATLCFAINSYAKAQVDLQNTGTFFVKTGTDTLYIDGNFTNSSSAAFTNNGWFHLKGNFMNSQASMATGTGTIYLNGAGAQSIATTASSAFNKLTVNKASGLVSLSTNATVNNMLTLTSGKISIGDYNLTIGNSGSITGASSASYIVAEGTGTLTQRVNSNTTKLFPVGISSYYTPASVGLSFLSVTDNISVRVMDKVYSKATTGNLVTSKAVNATWFINEGVIGGSVATITLQWPAALEMPGFNRNFSRLAAYNLAFWDYGPSDIVASGSDPYTVTRSGFLVFTPYAVSTLNALPVTWLTLSGKNKNNDNYIYWSTAAEKDNSYFVVEASDNGVNFSDIGHVRSAGNFPGAGEYNFIHYNISSNVNYYRIKQVDIDGRSSYSKIIKVVATFEKNALIVLNNPVKDHVTVSIELNTAAKGNIMIANAAGKIIRNQKTVLQAGNNIVEINNFNYPIGLYYLVYTDDRQNNLPAKFIAR